MKKHLVFLIILLVLFFPLTFAQEQNASAESVKEQKSLDNIKEKTNAALNKELSIFPNNIVRTFFKLSPESPLTTEKIILLLCIFLGMIILLQNILIITPFFEGKKSWAGAVIITSLISISGSLNTFLNFLLNLANAVNLLEEWSSLRIVFIFLILFAFFYGIGEFVRTMKEKSEVEKAAHSGMKAGAEIKKLKMKSDIEKI